MTDQTRDSWPPGRPHPVNIWQAIHEHLDWHPDRFKAQYYDATYHASITLVRQLFEHVDEAMSHNGVDYPVREAVIRQALAGVASADAAAARIQALARATATAAGFTPARPSAGPAVPLRFPADRPAWLGNDQPWPCGRCNVEVDNVEPHTCPPAQDPGDLP